MMWKCQTPSWCSYVQGWQIVPSVLEKHPCALLLNHSTFNSCHLFIVSDCRHFLAIFIVSPHHLFFEDSLHHQSSTSSPLPLQPPTDRPVQETSTSFTSLIRNPSLGLSAVGASRDLFITLQNSEQIQRKCPTMIENQKSQSLILGSSEVGKLGEWTGPRAAVNCRGGGRVAREVALTNLNSVRPPPGRGKAGSFLA